MLAAASVVDVDTDRGESVELWTISSEGQSVAASAPRLSVASGMRLECRLATEDAPLHVWAVIESAEYRSQARAALTLRVLDVESEGYERRAPRMPLSASGVVRATVCDRIPPGERLPARIVDLSESGVGIVVDDIRPRPGDRMWLSARFIEGELGADLRVAHVRPIARGGQMIVGCSFIDPEALRGVVSRVVSRLAGTGREQSGAAPLRESLGID
ncbi:MAG TPA: PilZ domain-containing protein [Gaiellales bacterium]|nr:PilZ domain-containing protein [Gaiellales bacterium]